MLKLIANSTIYSEVLCFTLEIKCLKRVEKSFAQFSSRLSRHTNGLGIISWENKYMVYL